MYHRERELYIEEIPKGGSDDSTFTKAPRRGGKASEARKRAPERRRGENPEDFAPSEAVRTEGPRLGVSRAGRAGN